MSLTPALTLTPAWTATGPSCTYSDDWWVWNYDDIDGDDAWVVNGGPSQVTDCYPSGYGASVTYAGSQCPSGFTQVSATVLDPDVVCCPTVNSFTYITSTVYREETFRCGSELTADVTSSLTSTDFSLSTQALTETTVVVGQHLFALGIVYTTPTPSPTTTPTDSSDSSSLTTGAAAGIGVAVAVAVLLAAAVIVLAWRRRRRSSTPPPKTTKDLHTPSQPPYPLGRGSSLAKEGEPGGWELDGQSNVVNELPAHQRVNVHGSAELQG